jgi:hypothetical protein
MKITIDAAGTELLSTDCMECSVVALPSDITPAQLTSDQNDYNPTGLGLASTLRVSSDAARTITGLTGGADGRIVILHNVGGNAITLKDESASSAAANRFALAADLVLGADECCTLHYDATSSRWRVIGAARVPYGSTANTVAQGNDTRFPAYVDPVQRVLSSPLPNVATAITLVNGTAYFVYLGRTTVDFTPKYVEFYVNTGGSGAQTAEVGLFSSTGPPNKGNLSLTKLVSTNSVSSLTSTGVKRNSSAFATSVAAGTHLWAGVRTAMATNQPALSGLCMDFSQGRVLSTAAAGALTGSGPWTGAIISVGQYLNTAIVPDLRVSLD